MGSKKYSISLPEDLAEIARAQSGSKGFSAYIAEALEQRVAMDKLDVLIADFEKDNEPFTREEIETAREELGFARRRNSHSTAV